MSKLIIQYFSDEEIIKRLCKFRAKLAQARSDKHVYNQLTKSKKFNYHLTESKQPDFLTMFNEELSSLLPRRRQWVKIGKNARQKGHRNLISSFDKNYYSLLKTIKRDKVHHKEKPYLQNLKEFIERIKLEIEENKFLLKSPKIIPKPKVKINENEIIPCRPISVYTLKDRIVLSIVNKFLTDTLDPYFSDSSYAFRTKRKNNEGLTVSHHDCIDALLEFLVQNPNKEAWAFECDIKKFFDCVDHQLLRERLKKLVLPIMNGNQQFDLGPALNIFEQYLQSYSFSHKVENLNSDEDYWMEFGFKGKYEWVKKELNSQLSISRDQKIGVPQGGALSGLISNILLHSVDKEMNNEDIFYVRFCDDMLVASMSFEAARNAKSTYLRTMKQSKLLCHTFNPEFVWKSEKPKKDEIKLHEFYTSKSKGPYKWTAKENGINWISFVGYEISFNGEVRVRKKSLLKELNKQNEILRKMKSALKNKRRVTSLSAIQTMYLKLIGMSVSRVNMFNYSFVKNQMCWKSGFRKLNDCNSTRNQMKKLDRNRNKNMSLFESYVFKLPDIESSKNNKSRQIIKYNKPFSYYYQIIERSKNAAANNSGC